MCGSNSKLSKRSLDVSLANCFKSKKMKMDFIEFCKTTTKQYTYVLNKGLL